MKIRGLLVGLLVAVALGGCARSTTAPEAPEPTVSALPLFDGSQTPPPDTTTNRGGGGLGSNH